MDNDAFVAALIGERKQRKAAIDAMPPGAERDLADSAEGWLIRHTFTESEWQMWNAEQRKRVCDALATDDEWHFDMGFPERDYLLRILDEWSQDVESNPSAA